MAKIDKTYHDLLLDILQHGFKHEDPNRKGVQRIQIPHTQIKHDFKDGFPAITTKKLYWKGIVGELLWFLRGDNNIKYLVDNGINIWNKDAYNYYKKTRNDNNVTYETFINWIKGLHKEGEVSIGGGNTFNLGRIYGAQWRNFRGIKYNPNPWNNDEHIGLDQISNLIKGLKETPMSTKHIVTAWNPAELDDMALPPCHWSFEILVEPLKIGSRCKYINNEHFEKALGVHLDNYNSEPEHLKTVIGFREDYCDKQNIPKYQFTLKWHQRSVDTFLGLPFNIASYALLAQIIGKMTNMIPKTIIGDLSNVHIYEPHLEQVKEQLNRDADKYNNCDLSIDTLTQVQLEEGLKHIDNKNIVINNFNLKNYESYPSIKAEMLAYNK